MQRVSKAWQKRQSAASKAAFGKTAKTNFPPNSPARDAGVSESRACRYFTGKVSCTIRGGGEDDAFYERVKNMLLAEGEVSDAIGRLTDRAYYNSLSYEERQRYTLALSERYLKALERFRREREFEGVQKNR